MEADARIVSLVPSVTESLRAWGIDPVACTRFCEQPDLPHVGGTKNPDVRSIVALAPDLVVLDEQENRIEDHDAMVAAGLAVHVLDVVSVAGAITQVGELARRLGRVWQPAPPPEPAPPRLRVFVPIWRRPWMTVNGSTYGSDLLARLGAGNVFADHVDRYPEVGLDAAAAASPQLVVVPTEPYTFVPSHLDELRASVAPVVVVDGRDLFWWGVRTPGAMERLRAVLDGAE